MVAIQPRLVVSTAEAAIDVAIAGLGVTRVLSYQIAAARQRRAAGNGARGFRAAGPACQPGLRSAEDVAAEASRVPMG